MNTSLSIFARALATENLSFSFDSNAETAAFDVKNRHLILPVWDVSETVRTMLVAHEISHALWTPYKESEEILDAAEKEGYHKPLLQRIANIIEDVRIEKLMKAKYPGTRRDFFLGYKEIIDRNMFGLAEMNYDKAPFVNRINIFFKWGVPGFVNISMSNEERKIIDMIDNVQTFAEVYEVAKIIYKHPDMKEVVEKIEQQSMGTGTKTGEGIGETGKDYLSGMGKHDGETYVASSITLSPIKNMENMIISTDRILAQFEEINNGLSAQTLIEYREFVKHSDAFVRQLAMQFERRKAADEIRRERPKQTGMLNLDRLHQFRTHDDIFLSKIIKQDGKNHGIVFLLDFSSSMSARMSDCILQLFQLVWFCEKAKIPFEVFGFTDVSIPCAIGYEKYNADYNAWRVRNPNVCSSEFKHPDFHVEAMNERPTSVVYGHARLLHLASSQDDAAKRERLMAFIHGSFVKEALATPHVLRLGGTPTVEGAAAAMQFTRDWVKAHDIQIPTFMLVTDGQPNHINTVSEGRSKSFYGHNNGSLTVTNEILQTMDRINLADYPQTCMPNLILMAMFNGMRTELNARIIGMYVGSNHLSFGEYTNFCLSNKEILQINNLPYHEREALQGTSPRFQAMKAAYKDGAIVTHPDCNPGYDTFFLIKTPKIVKDEDAIAESGTFTKIKNTFIKTMGSRGSSRVFLTRYVDIVAGQKIQKGIGAEYAMGAF